MNKENTNKVVAVSIAITGPSEIEHEIIEIGAVKMINGVISDQFHTYVRPKGKIPAALTDTDGIIAQLLETAPDIEDAMEKFLDFVQDYIFVSYNAEFQLRFLKKAAEDINQKFAPTWMDLLTASKSLFQKLKKYDMYDLCNSFGIPTASIKHKDGEAKACASLYRILMGEMEENGIPADTFYRPITPSFVIRNVCKYYNVNKDELVGPTKRKQIAEQRQVAMYLVRELCNESFVKIGKLFNRDHATVVYSVRSIEDALRQHDNILESSVQSIIEEIYNSVAINDNINL